jgi:diguanylate cyclase
VPEVWGDSDAARALSIRTYVSVPVRLADGRVWGTLCGADSRPAPGAERHLSTMGMIARLLAVEVERAAAHAEARRAAELDPLTGCANRRGVEAWLARALEAQGAVCAVYVDLDNFKAVNDLHGHAAGDDVLREVARVLRARTRPGDLVGRLGGDEFVVAAVLSPEQDAGFLSRWDSALEVPVDLPCGRRVVRASVGRALLPAAEAATVLAAADEAMYVAKRTRRADAGRV